MTLSSCAVADRFYFFFQTLDAHDKGAFAMEHIQV